MRSFPRKPAPFTIFSLRPDERYFPLARGKKFTPELIRGRAVSQVIEDLWEEKIASDAWETEIAPAPREVATLLRIVPGVLVFRNNFTHYFGNGRPAETGTFSYRIDRVKFKFSTADITEWQARKRPQKRGETALNHSQN